MYDRPPFNDSHLEIKSEYQCRFYQTRIVLAKIFEILYAGTHVHRAEAERNEELSIQFL